MPKAQRDETAQYQEQGGDAALALNKSPTALHASSSSSASASGPTQQEEQEAASGAG